MSSKPLIGITVDCNHDPEDPRTRGKLELNWNYAQAVADAGGVPILIPPTADMSVIAKLIDGWVIPGGNDIDAKHFGEQNHPKVTPIEEERFLGEKALYEQIPADLPVLGICYGCQFINVMRGGKLIQHLPDAVGHETHTGGTLEDYSIDDTSKLSAAAGATAMKGKSYHHQAIGELGSDLRIVARHQDGTVEAIEAPDKPWLIGVQWHPERLLEDAATFALFKSFIEAASKFAATKQ